MMKSFLIPLICSLPILAFAQNLPNKNNTLNVELGGNAVFYSINYERMVRVSDHFRLSPRIGLMYLPIANIKSNRDYGNFNIPLELNALYAKNATTRNFPELGLGLTFISLKDGYSLKSNGSTNQNYKFGRVALLRAGFRHQKPEGGLMYRAGLLIPFAQDDFSENRVGDDIFLRIYAGFSIGYTF